jgi:hypothetical protein
MWRNTALDGVRNWAICLTSVGRGLLIVCRSRLLQWNRIRSPGLIWRRRSFIRWRCGFRSCCRGRSGHCCLSGGVELALIVSGNPLELFSIVFAGHPFREALRARDLFQQELFTRILVAILN